MRPRVEFKKLLEPFQIGKMALRNRLVMPPMVTNLATEKGEVTQRLKDYYEERARGGVGLVIVEATCVDAPAGKGYPNGIIIDHDRYVPGLRELAEAIKRHGARAAIQLQHSGRDTSAAITGCEPVAPSAIAAPGREIPRELTVEEIERIVSRFAEAAARAKEAGFDAVEIHGAHAYLLAGFLSLASNKRRDNYGGETENRARFLVEVTKATKEAVGQPFPVLCRMNGSELGIEDGFTLDEAKKVAQMVEAAGADAIHVSAVGYGPHAGATFPEEPGLLVPLASGIKEELSIPVVTVGKITPQVGEQVLAEGRADLVSLGRALIADPELPNKLSSNRLEDIVPCIRCLDCIVRILFAAREVTCAVNPAVGREREYRITPAERGKRVVVIGGGPAGMEAARVAALRGHEVTIIEKGLALGGQLIPAAIPPRKEIEPLIGYYETQLKKLGVKVEMGREASLSLLEEAKPEEVVVATGVVPIRPEIPGIERARVASATDVLTGKAQVGQRVLVIGGEMVGCETAEFLADQGKNVTITRRSSRLLSKMMPILRRRLLDRLRQKRVRTLTGVKYEEWTDEGLVITTSEGKRDVLEADDIVIAAGAQPNTALAEQLKGKVPAIHLAGDCVEPRRIADAIGDGFRIGRTL